MLRIDQRLDTMIGKARRPAPDHDVPMIEANASRPVVAPVTTEQEDRRQPERHRDNWLLSVALVAILMERQPCAGFVAVDQTGVGREITIPGLFPASAARR